MDFLNIMDGHFYHLSGEWIQTIYETDATVILNKLSLANIHLFQQINVQCTYTMPNNERDLHGTSIEQCVSIALRMILFLSRFHSFDEGIIA